MIQVEVVVWVFDIDMKDIFWKDIVNIVKVIKIRIVS